MSVDWTIGTQGEGSGGSIYIIFCTCNSGHGSCYVTFHTSMGGNHRRTGCRAYVRRQVALIPDSRVPFIGSHCIVVKTSMGSERADKRDGCWALRDVSEPGDAERTWPGKDGEVLVARFFPQLPGAHEKGRQVTHSRLCR